MKNEKSYQKLVAHHQGNPTYIIMEDPEKDKGHILEEIMAKTFLYNFEDTH